MAFKGTAGKSASGASMSKYDVEVEARLTALEKALADLAVKCEERSSGGSDERVDKMLNNGLLDEVISYQLQVYSKFISRFPNP